jgi:hypothetical protein
MLSLTKSKGYRLSRNRAYTDVALTVKGKIDNGKEEVAGQVLLRCLTERLSSATLIFV